MKNTTVRMRLGMLRLFFERIIEWGWDDAPARCPVFEADLPKVDDPLPKFLDDASAARFMRAAAQLEPLPRLVVEMLARTGMRVSELCDLSADAVMIIGDAHWLRIPVGKLHHDRLIPSTPPLSTSSARGGRRSGPMTAGCCSPTTVGRSTVTASTGSSNASVAVSGSTTCTPTGCATPSPPKPSTAA